MWRGVKSTSGLTKHVNSRKISITLPSCQTCISASILEYNIINHPDLPSNNFEEDISPGVLNNGKERIRPANINNNKEDIKLADIDK